MADHPPAMPHGPIREVFPDVFVVTGGFRMGPGVTIPRNMTIVRQGTELTLINSVRLTPEGEAELEALGTPKHLVRIGAGHGADDPYYVQRRGLTLWAPPKMRHRGGLRAEELTEGSSPIAKSRVFTFVGGIAPEGALLLDGGVLVTCDSFQHWETFDGCSFLGKVSAKALGFGPAVIGTIWAKRMGPGIREDFERLRELPFSHVISGHGEVLRDRAREELERAITKRYGAR